MSRSIQRAEGKDTWSWWLNLLTAVVATFFLTCFFFGTRNIMDPGAFVASGGPREIEHPASGWTWIWIVSFTVVVLSLFFFLLTLHCRGGADLLTPLWWPLLFISVGWNYLECALFRSDRVIWGLLVCGVVFAAMGALPLVFMLQAKGCKGVLKSLKAHRRTVLLQLTGSAAGIYLGVLFLRLTVMKG